jgi:phage gp29-like protein
MATASNDETLQEMPPAPPPGEIVDEQRLYLTQISQWRNTLAFGGTTNPSVIWSSMSRNEATAILYYRELEDKDEDVGNCLDTLKLAALQRDRLVTPGEDTTQGHEVADFIQAQFDELPNFHQILDSMLDASGYGFSVAEMIFDVSEGQVELEDVRDRPQELFLFGNRFRPQVGPLQLLPSPWAMDGEEMPQQKFLISTCRQRGGNRMGRPLLRSVFWPSWFKRNDLRMWLQYAEKGPGTAVVKYNDSDSEQQKQLAAELAKALVERNAVAVPNNFNYDVDLLTKARDISPDVYVTLFRAMQYNIARRILGETLTSFGASESGKGSQAQGEVHADTLEQRIIELCRGLASVINRQLVRPLVLWNYGPDAPMPTWGFDLEEEEDLSKRIVIDSALQRMGKGISEKYVVDRYMIPATEPEDKVLVPNVNAPQVALQARDVANYAEAMLMSPEMKHDHAEFDKLFAELKGDSLDLMKARVKEIVDAAQRGRR